MSGSLSSLLATSENTQYTMTTFLPMLKPCSSRLQTKPLRAEWHVNGPCDHVIPKSRTLSAPQHSSSAATLNICATPLGPRTSRRCLGPNRSQDSSGPAGLNVHSIFMEGVKNTCPSTNCALADLGISKATCTTKASVFRSRSFVPQGFFFDLLFE